MDCHHSECLCQGFCYIQGSCILRHELLIENNQQLVEKLLPHGYQKRRERIIIQELEKIKPPRVPHEIVNNYLYKRKITRYDPDRKGHIVYGNSKKITTDVSNDLFCFYCNKQLKPKGQNDGGTTMRKTFVRIIPKNKGGNTRKQNTLDCCRHCRNFKANLLPWELCDKLEKQILLNRPYRSLTIDMLKHFLVKAQQTVEYVRVNKQNLFHPGRMQQIQFDLSTKVLSGTTLVNENAGTIQEPEQNFHEPE